MKNAGLNLRTNWKVKTENIFRFYFPVFSLSEAEPICSGSRGSLRVQIRQNLLWSERRVEFGITVMESFDGVSDSDVGADAVHQRRLADGL